MKKIILTILLASFQFWAFGQDKIVIDQPYFGLPSYDVETIEIDSFIKFPSRIQFIAKEILNISMTDFVENIRFVKGQIIDLDSLFAKDSVTQIDYKYAIPKYQLFFELTESKLSIQKYCFELSLDQYGQILFLEWPREGYTKRSSFLYPEQIKAEAIQYAKSKKYKTAACRYELKYDRNRDKICWYLSFFQKAVVNKHKYSKEYKTIVMDALSLKVLEEYDRQSVATKD